MSRSVRPASVVKVNGSSLIQPDCMHSVSLFCRKRSREEQAVSGIAQNLQEVQG